MAKFTIELDAKLNKEFTPEQLRFIERHFLGYLAVILEEGGLGNLITPEIDWDNQQEAEQLFGVYPEDDNDLYDAVIGRHQDAAECVISYLDDLYDFAVEGVKDRGGKFVSMYEGGRHGEKAQEPEEDEEYEDEMPVTSVPVNPDVIVETTNICSLCDQEIETAILIGDEIYHSECGKAMQRNLEPNNVGPE